jgi:mRNA interferase MazF
MVARGYVPDAGDLIWIDFDPQAGHEQAGRRPGLVLSPCSYNAKTGLAIVCPVTSQVKGYPFEVALSASVRFRGAVLADQLKSVDWRERRAERGGKASPAVMEEVKARLQLLLGIQA